MEDLSLETISAAAWVIKEHEIFSGENLEETSLEFSEKEFCTKRNAVRGKTLI